MRSPFVVVLALALGACVTRTSGHDDDVGSQGNGASTDASTSTSVGTTSAAMTSAAQTGPLDDGGPASSSSGGEPGTPCVSEPNGAWECDPWCQDCPEGEKCIAWSNDGALGWDATRCAPVADDPRQPGQSCTVEGSGMTGIDNCDVGAMCWDVDPETNTGICIALCQGTPEDPSCAPGFMCTIANGGVLNLCLPMCDPIAQDCDAGNACLAWDPSCEGGVACLPAGPEAGFICLPDTGDWSLWDPCEYTNACPAGSFCAPADLVPGCVGAFGCCSQLCSFAVPDPDALCEPEGQICVPFYAEGQAPPGYELIGACVLP